MAFPVTRLSVVEALRSQEPGDRVRGLAGLAEAYWRPVHEYLRLRFRLDDDAARDLTQDLFTRILEKELLASFDPGRARLRTFLRVLADRLAIDALRARARGKRGGGEQAEPLDERMASEGANPEEIFERAWRRDVLSRALAGLKQHCETTGRSVRFEVFAARELADAPPSYEELARRFSLKPTDVTNHLGYARRELRRIALELLATAATSPVESREDFRALFDPGSRT